MKSIVLAGGPNSGKSKVLSSIKNRNIVIDGFDRVVCISEIAEQIIKCNPNLRHNSQIFQTVIFHSQMQIEETCKSLFGETNTLVVYDRGLCDAKAYLTDSFDVFEAENNFSHLQMIGRYDAVFFLAAALDPLKYQNTSIRTENLEEATLLSKRTFDAWRIHPHFYYIEATETFEEKVINTIDKITSTRINWDY